MKFRFSFKNDSYDPLKYIRDTEIQRERKRERERERKNER